MGSLDSAMTTAINSRDLSNALGGKHDSDGTRELQRTLRASVSSALDVRTRGHGLHGMVLAIRDALAQGDKADELAAKIDGALDAASKHLAEQGFSQDEINAAVSRFRDRLAHEIDGLASQNAPAAGGDAATTGAAQRVAVAEASREVKRERFSLDILTAEGDKVSIRFKSLSVTDAAVAQVSDGSATSTAAQASVISRGRFKVEVDGDLNDSERAAIGDLLDKVDGIAEDFFGGDVQAAFAAASRVGIESDALSAFSLRLSYSKSTAVAKAYASTAALTDAPAAPVQTPVLSPVQKPITAPPVTTPPLVSKVADAPVGDSTTPESTTAPAPASSDSSTPPTPASSARQTIASFTKDVLARLSTAGEGGTAKFSMRWKVEFLVSALSSVAPPKDVEAQSAVNGLENSLSA
jgi:hypothetical protein